jgi:hypothetical protein
MPRHTHLASEHAPIPDVRRAGDPDLCHQQAALPDAHVVSDLHEVVDLGPRTDHGVVDAASVDRRVRTDLHVILDHAASDVRNLVVPPVAKNVAESIGAKSHAGMHDHAPTDLRAAVRHDAGIQVRVIADANTLRHVTMRFDHDAVTERRTIAKHDVRAHADAGAEPNAAAKLRRRVHAGDARPLAMESGNQRQQRLVRIVDDHSRRCPARKLLERR